MTYAFLITLAAASIAIGILIALWKSASSKYEKEYLLEKAAHEATKNTTLSDSISKCAELAENLEKAQSTIARLEAVLKAKQVEITALESDNYACNSPAIVRERLRAILSPKSPDPLADATIAYGRSLFGGVSK